MAEASPAPEADAPRSVSRNWDALAAVLAALIGFLALLVSGYTAHIQRQQVRAQVWPYVIAGNDDAQHMVAAYNKGVGPAIMRSAEILVDGKAQKNWKAVLSALGLPERRFSSATISPNVLSPGETVRMIQFEDEDKDKDKEAEKKTGEVKRTSEDNWRGFRKVADHRLTIKLCFCSTLNECWMYRDPDLVGYKAGSLSMESVAQCPQLPPEAVFNN